MGLESLSEPDDMDFPMDIDEPEEQDLEGEEEQFYDTPSPDTSVKEGRKSSVDLDTEDSDPMRPVTPGGGSRASHDLEVDVQEEDRERDMNGKEDRKAANDFDEVDDDDDWVDPSLPTPIQNSPPPPEQVPPLAKGKSKSNGSGGSGKKSKRSKKSAVPVVKTPSPPAQSFPFPRSAEDHSQPQTQSQDVNNSNRSEKPKRMHTARARDGGRTQSGGVRGVLD
jgi:cysteine protease ATG4